MGADPLEFRRTMGLFATGVTVITVREGEVIHGMTANAVTSVSLDPLLVLVCVDSRTRMSEMLPRAGRFAINVLSEGQRPLSHHFSGRSSAPLEVEFAEIDRVPTLPDSLATLVCTVERLVDGGDHVVVFGRVDALERPTTGGRPLVYYAGDYRRIAMDARLRRLERQQRDRLEALNRMAQVIASSLNVDEVFDTFAEQIAQLVPHDAVSVTLLSEDGHSLERFALATTARIEPRVGERQDLDETAAGLAVRGSQTVWTNDMAADARFHGENDRRWIAEGFRSFISAPLCAKGRVIGALNVLSRVPDRFGESDVALVEQIANQVAIFLDNMYLHARVRQLVANEERHRIAHEMHDTVIQSLAGIEARLEAAERTRHDAMSLQSELRLAREAAQRAVQEVTYGVADYHLHPLTGLAMTHTGTDSRS